MYTHLLIHMPFIVIVVHKDDEFMGGGAARSAHLPWHLPVPNKEVLRSGFYEVTAGQLPA